MPRVSAEPVSISTLISRAAVQPGLEQKGDDVGVVQGAALGAVFLHVEALEEVQQARARRAGVVGHGRGTPSMMASLVRVWWVRSSGIMVTGAPQCMTMISGFGIDVDVELRRRGGVAAFEQAAAHEDDLAQARSPSRGLGLQRQAKVGQRPQGAQRYGVREARASPSQQ